MTDEIKQGVASAQEASSKMLKLAERIIEERVGWRDDGGRLGVFLNGTDMDMIVSALRAPLAEGRSDNDPFKRKQVEALCRAVCKVEGVDPDDDTFGDGCDPVWTRYADAIAEVLHSQSPAATREITDNDVRRFVESAVLWIPDQGVKGRNGLDATETIDLITTRLVAALRSRSQPDTATKSEPRG